MAQRGASRVRVAALAEQALEDDAGMGLGRAGSSATTMRGNSDRRMRNRCCHAGERVQIMAAGARPVASRGPSAGPQSGRLSCQKIILSVCLELAALRNAELDVSWYPDRHSATAYS
jgi:hypothetical protein